MEQIEQMDQFFTSRIEGYDAHMLRNIDGAREAYALVARLLPEGTCALLDLGCGTGLELSAVFERFPEVHVTGVDLTRAMLDKLQEKYADKTLTLICGDYFQVDFGAGHFDAALSFQTMHHFTHDEKRGLYRRIRRALKPDGVYVEADYIVGTQEEENEGFREKEKKLREMGNPQGFFHIDTPCTVVSQLRLCREAGFAEVHMAKRWENMAIIVSKKQGMGGAV